MKIKIIAVGKIKENYLKAGVAEYNKRLNNSIEIVELPDQRIPDRPSAKELEAIKINEGRKNPVSADKRG